MAEQKALQIQGTMCANTNQLRRIAGTAQKLNLPYALDFRINSLLDAGGIHLLSIDNMARRQHGVICKCFCWLKLQGLPPEVPIPAYLSVRLQDFIVLQPYNKPILNAAGTMVHETLPRGQVDPPNSRRGTGRFIDGGINMADLVSDEMTPESADPKQITYTPPAGFNQ